MDNVQHETISDSQGFEQEGRISDSLQHTEAKLDNVQHETISDSQHKEVV